MKNKLFPTGVVNGEFVKKIFNYANKNKFAIPAINIFNTSTINACLEVASLLNSPIIIQISNGSSLFNSGINRVLNNNNIYTIKGSKSLAIHTHIMAKAYKSTVILHTDHCDHNNLSWLDGLICENKKYLKQHNRALFSSHMIDLSSLPVKQNIKKSLQYFKIFKQLNIFLEIELGITGGEEDGVDNTNVQKNKLYTNPEDVYYAYNKFIKLNDNFSIAAAFGNMHGVYKKGNINLKPKILKKCQKKICDELKTPQPNPINFVFHGGSGSTLKEIKEAISYGVVKINVDTDLQYAFTQGVYNYMKKNSDFLKQQIGNSKDPYCPNKKYYDPRVWIKNGENSFKEKLCEIFKNFNNVNRLK